MFDPSLPDFGTEILYALKRIFEPAMDQLNEALQRDPGTAKLVTSGKFAPLKPSHVQIGAQRTVWDSSGGLIDGCLRVCIIGEMMQNMLPFFKSKQEEIGMGMSGSEWTTNVWIVFHPDALRLKDANVETRVQEIAARIVASWAIFGVMNTLQNNTLYLQSKQWSEIQYTDPITGEQGYDLLSRCSAVAGYISPMTLGYNNSQTVYAIHFVHTGVVEI